MRAQAARGPSCRRRRCWRCRCPRGGATLRGLGKGRHNGFASFRPMYVGRILFARQWGSADQVTCSVGATCAVLPFGRKAKGDDTDGRERHRFDARPGRAAPFSARSVVNRVSREEAQYAPARRLAKTEPVRGRGGWRNLGGCFDAGPKKQALVSIVGDAVGSANASEDTPVVGAWPKEATRARATLGPSSLCPDRAESLRSKSFRSDVRANPPTRTTLAPHAPWLFASPPMTTSRRLCRDRCGNAPRASQARAQQKKQKAATAQAGESRARRTRMRTPRTRTHRPTQQRMHDGHR